VSQVHEEFARRINRQRVAPRLTDYCYHLLRGNLQAFYEFKAKVPTGALLLDVGCGYKPWATALPECTTIGVDYSAEWSSADALASGDALPFCDNTFDALICSEVLEHTRNPRGVVEELRRVCKPGAVLYVTSPMTFHEHGIPYDFQRFTRYWYKDVFSADEILALEETNSSVTSGLTAINMSIECSPLRLAVGLKHVIYVLTNLAGLAFDFFLEKIVSRIMRSYRVYFFNMPMGFALVVRLRK